MQYTANDIKNCCLYIEVAHQSTQPCFVQAKRIIEALFKSRMLCFTLPSNMTEKGVRSLTSDLYLFLVQTEVNYLKNHGLTQSADDLVDLGLYHYETMSSLTKLPLGGNIDVNDVVDSCIRLRNLNLFKLDLDTAKHFYSFVNLCSQHTKCDSQPVIELA